MEVNNDMLPYKIVDCRRERRFGIVCNSLEDLIARGSEKLELCGQVKVVLEQDGTEVDEEEYFNTLEKNTSFMLLEQDEKWIPAGRIRLGLRGDEVDGGRGIQSLLERLHSDIGHVSLLGGSDLELLCDMDPDSLQDIVQDRGFLDQLKEASGRFLNEKRQAQEAMDLLKIYHSQQKDQDSNPVKAQ